MTWLNSFFERRRKFWEKKMKCERCNNWMPNLRKSNCVVTSEISSKLRLENEMQTCVWFVCTRANVLYKSTTWRKILAFTPAQPKQFQNSMQTTSKTTFLWDLICIESLQWHKKFFVQEFIMWSKGSSFGVSLEIH